MRRSLLANLLLVVTFTACGGSRAREAEATRVAGKSIEDVLAAHNDSLMALPGVVGTAIGRCDGTPCIRVFMRDSAAARATRIAERLEGYPVRVEVSGMFRAR
ncbi:MAG TPA: hypothetical protein VH539_03880 [Gemmatimonadaceae bacterium]|jgi:hypothetical protein